MRRRRSTVAIAVAVLIAWTMAVAPLAAAASAQRPGLIADLDGKPIPLETVGFRFCHDFDYPAIHCYSSPTTLDAAVSSRLALAAADVTYVVVYEYTAYQGAYMYMSQDYQILATIGWNDRISSFSVRNSKTGKFWTDWFYGGTNYYFCCNSQVSSLGALDDTFSSVFHY